MRGDDKKRETAAAWLAANAKAIADYNAKVAKRGVFSDSWRSF